MLNKSQQVIVRCSSQPIPDTAKQVFRGRLFSVYQWRQKLFDGTVAVFEKLKRPDTAVCLAVSHDKRMLVLKEKQPGRDWFWSLPGGRIDESESARQAAARELWEETGYKTDDWHDWFVIQPVSKIDWQIYYFLALYCQQTGKIKPDAGERLETHLLTWSEFLDLIYQPNWYDQSLTCEISRLRHLGQLAEFKTRIGM